MEMLFRVQKTLKTGRISAFYPKYQVIQHAGVEIILKQASQLEWRILQSHKYISYLGNCVIGYSII